MITISNVFPPRHLPSCFSPRREPVVMNKLAYHVVVNGKSEEGHWNQRTRDVANVARWIGNQTERAFNWQIVNLADTPIDDFHDSPILYIAGDQPLDFTPEQDAKLRQFVLEGGLILGNPDGNYSANFIKTFQKLGGRLFPAYEMRNLPVTHPIYTSEQFRGPEVSRRPMLGLSNGVRELMICPFTDSGRAWQARAWTTDEAFINAANIFFYVAGKNPRKKGETHIVRAEGSVDSHGKTQAAGRIIRATLILSRRDGFASRRSCTMTTKFPTWP